LSPCSNALDPMAFSMLPKCLLSPISTRILASIL
jgi:hypothetical protein